MPESDVWRSAFTNWDRRVVPDLQQYFQVDAYDLDDISRPWRWLRTLVLSLLDIPDSRLARGLDRS